jgi:pimeloyl-ACP methyl ester carboxylesterase
MNKNNFPFLSLLIAMLIISNGCTSDPPISATSFDGVEISFSNQGSGEPAIILVHGWGNDNSIWVDQVGHFSEKYQVIAIELAGYGKSGNARTEWTMSSFGEDVAAVVRTLDLQQVVLVGFSMGGAVVVEASRIIPEEVAGIVLVDNLHNPEEQYPPPVIHFIDSVYMDLINNPTLEKLVGMGFFVNNTEQSFERVKGMGKMDKTGWRESLLELLRWSNEDCTEALTSVKVPVIAINADYQPTEVEIFRKYVPGFEAKIISGTGHLVMWDAKDEFNRLLEESIQEIIK